MKRGPAAALGLALAAAAPLAIALAKGTPPGADRLAYPDAPPPATTGGFGEPTCVACHFATSPDTLGALTLQGLDDTYKPGDRYALTVELARTDMAAAGFELSARFGSGPARGRQAGRFRLSGSDVTVTAQNGVDYVHQTLAGATPSTPGLARWRIEWTAPEAAGPVRFHVAANAANGDESPLGDRVYAVEQTTRSVGDGCGNRQQATPEPTRKIVFEPEADALSPRPVAHRLRAVPDLAREMTLRCRASSETPSNQAVTAPEGRGRTSSDTTFVSSR